MLGALALLGMLIIVLFGVETRERLLEEVSP
jgi:hypothetical protein